MTAGVRWRVIVDGPLEGALNMARDHALALSLREGQGVLRFYRWRVPTLSFGRNERAHGRFDPEALSAAGVEAVRRPTGGRAVLHHRELTYSVCLPLRTPGGVRHVYRSINRGLVAGLRELGVPAVASGDDAPVLRPDAGPCFQAPAPDEVAVQERKLVGSAQVRIDGALLQHGSVLIHDDQPRVRSLAVDDLPGSASTPGAAALAEYLNPLPDPGELVAALTRGLRGELGGDWPATGEERTFAPPPVEEVWLHHYRAPDWTWRR